MKQSEYLYELKENLVSRVTPEVLKDILLDYESFFVSGREDGKNDDEISKELGSPAFLAKALMEEHISNETTLPLDKRITNPGRRLCAYLIDNIIAIIPTLILSVFIGAIGLPYLLFITCPSPLVGAMGYMGFASFSSSTHSAPSTINVKSIRLITETGEQVIKEDNVSNDINEVNENNWEHNNKPNPITSILATLTLVFYLFYALICTLLFRGQTIGKKLMHIKVRRSSTEPINRGAIFYREFLGKTLINSIPIIPLVSFFTILFTKEHKALHDMLADTIVLDV